MNKPEVMGNSNKQKGKPKSKIEILTDNDLMFEAEVKKEEMFGKLQINIGKQKKN